MKDESADCAGKDSGWAPKKFHGGLPISKERGPEDTLSSKKVQSRYPLAQWPSAASHLLVSSGKPCLSFGPMSPPDPVKSAFDDWKFADRAAFEAEMKLADATLSHHQLRSSPPSADMIGDARRLRTLADNRLSTALEPTRTGAAP